MSQANSPLDSLVVETTRRILSDFADPRDAKRTLNPQVQTQLWTALEDAGLTRAWVDAEFNGAGASIGDGFDILKTAGQFALAASLAETLLAAWLLALHKIQVPSGKLSIAPTRPRDRLLLNASGTLSGRVSGIPYARDADHMTVLAGNAEKIIVALVQREHCTIKPATNIAGDALDSVSFDDVTPLKAVAAIEGFTAEHLTMMGAAARAMQMSGGLQAILDLTVAYANERIAFERPLAKFQVIQHNLARLAGETAAAIAAAGSAADAIEHAIMNATSFDAAVLLEVASAKIRVGEAVTIGAGIAHQVHGAIGYSQEHVLHRYTQRLWSWRDDFGDETFWATRLGNFIAARGADELWPLIASR